MTSETRNWPKIILERGENEDETEKERNLKGYRRTTRTHRPQIRYHLVTTDVICIRVFSLRHVEVERKRKEIKIKKGKGKGKRK